MNAVTRWKTIATVAVAFSAGNLFATACQDGNDAHAEEEDDGSGSADDGGDGSTPPPVVTEEDFAALTAEVEELRSELSRLEDRVDDHECFFNHITDYDNTGSSVDREDHVSAVNDCRI